MGVINMAHGELMMIGAYATYVVQGLFQKYLPGRLRLVPAGGAAGGLRRLGADGRDPRARRDPLPLRPAAGDAAGHLGHQPDADAAGALVFGAQNVGVENPSWMSGGVVLLGNLQLPWNRIVIVGFAFAVLAAWRFLIARTRLGLFVRGVTQNRPDRLLHGREHGAGGHLCFALGSGIAEAGGLRA
jgi:urea transport system permease protein